MMVRVIEKGKLERYRQMEKQPQTSIVVGPNDLLMIQEILSGYLTFLSHRQGRPQKILDAQDLQQRLLALSHQECAIFPLNLGEVTLLCEAIILFDQTVRRLAPPSPEREATLQATRALRKALERLLPPGQGRMQQRRFQKRSKRRRK